jgi:hypothetical protein
MASMLKNVRGGVHNDNCSKEGSKSSERNSKIFIRNKRIN